jgi:hypothetical protein
MRLRTTLPVAAVLVAGLALPTSAPAASLVGKWDLGPLLDVRISVIQGKLRARALNNASACKVSKDEIVWKIGNGANGAFGTSEIFTFPGGVCYGREPAVQASFFLRPNNPNVLRVCGSNGLKAGVAPETDFSSPKAVYPCADYKRIVKKTPLPFTKSGTLAYFKNAYRSPAKRCPSTGPTTYRINLAEQPQDPMLRFTDFTINGAQPDVYSGSPQAGYVRIDTIIRKKPVSLHLKFATESGAIRGFTVTWPACVPD